MKKKPFNLADRQYPNFVKPELLLHPNLPKPLHGVNPRTIKGATWHKKITQAAAEKNNDCCWACGVWKMMGKRRQWLEGHERYDIDYNTLTATYLDHVALCHSCHNFIHSGRIYNQYHQGTIGYWYVKGIYEHGFQLLREAGLSPNPLTAYRYLILTGYNEQRAIQILTDKGMTPRIEEVWGDWYLIIDGEKHPAQFRNEGEWEAYYGS